MGDSDRGEVSIKHPRTTAFAAVHQYLRAVVIQQSSLQR